MLETKNNKEELRQAYQEIINIGIRIKSMRNHNLVLLLLNMLISQVICCSLCSEQGHLRYYETRTSRSIILGSCFFLSQIFQSVSLVLERGRPATGLGEEAKRRFSLFSSRHNRSIAFEQHQGLEIAFRRSTRFCKR